MFFQTALEIYAKDNMFYVQKSITWTLLSYGKKQ